MTETVKTQKILPQTITLDRWEGLSASVKLRWRDARRAEMSLWQLAAKVMRDWSDTAPKGGCYDKGEFTVRFQDGEVYKGRFDLKHWSEPDNDIDIAGHIRDFAECETGRRMPEWVMRDERRDHYIKIWMDGKDPKDVAGYARILDCYDLGDASPARLPAFDPSKVEIERLRFSVTQGEVLVKYDGEKIEQYGDKIVIDDAGKWDGKPDEHWLEVARREFHRRQPHQQTAAAA